MQKITPCLWFNNNAQEALDYYTAIFKDATIKAKQNYPEEMPLGGQLLTATIEVFGQEIMLLNAGHNFEFTHALSLVINCKDQVETDYYWNALSKDGEEEQCAWLKDKYGVSWQIVPVRLIELITQPDKEKANRAIQAMMQMRKIDIAKVEAAAG